MNTIKQYLLLAIAAVFLSACSPANEQQTMLHKAATIEASDECHLCGMLISNFGGPKGELFRNGVTDEQSNTVHKFCSTRDMFSFYLDPENNRNVTSMFVHDMSKAPWGQPNDEYFIDAKTAWYVVGSNKTGAMGKTLASFSKQSDAQAFAEDFNGEVITFSQVDLAALM